VSEPPLRIAVAGNPNVGKTSVFNGLTGERHKVGNYPGVTVQVREGRLTGEGDPIELLDLPGIYSLTPSSEDEAVAYRALVGIDSEAPGAVLVVLDASNLGRNLYLVTQLRELGVPLVLALNMIDVAKGAQLDVKVGRLSGLLGVPVIPTNARTGEGIPELREALRDVPPSAKAELLDASEDQSELAHALHELSTVADPARARWLLTAAATEDRGLVRRSAAEAEVLETVGEPRRHAAAAQLIERRYAQVDEWIAALRPEAVGRAAAPAMLRSQRIDRVLTHRVWGLLVFVGVMALVFQSIFTWAEPIMDAIEAGLGATGSLVAETLGPGLFTDLLTQGVIAGAGNVLVFVPQIALLFLFIGVLEDSGYMARAAFIIDRLMARVGLNGRAFVPLLSGYACAIPAIMGARTIASVKDRLVTILMIPFMSCSARLPIYALIIGALFDADRIVWGPFSVGGLILLAMYGLSTGSALVVGAIYKRTILAGPTPALLLELPPYRFPRFRNTALHVYDRTMDFIRDAGTIILAVTIVLWGLLSFPQVDERDLATGETAIEHSIGGRFGKAIEPALEPIGQDWRMGVGLVGSFAAREVLVSTLGLVHGIESADEDDGPLREQLASAVDPATGKKRYTPLRGIALMVFFVYACQCMSTLAVVRRETRSWRWPAFMFGSMTVLAYVAALLTYQVGLLLGFT
jgi:ferrous iron transport protein B